jgi:heme exporter protein C
MNHNYYEYSRPVILLKYSNKMIDWFLYISIVLAIAASYMVIGIIGTDIQQSDNYLVIYIHVPAAWLSLLIYLLITITSILFLINKNPFINIITQSGLIIGFIFTIITLITGSLWGKPMWGTFWVWDARLTSMALLAILYLINIIINISSTYNLKNSVFSSILIIIGVINIPIVKLSVEWWNTLHQTSSIIQLNSSIHISMLIPIFYMILSFSLLTMIYLIFNIRYQIIKRKINIY